jgi:hypothetical protein
MNINNNSPIKENCAPQRRGRFLVQEVEDRNELLLPKMKHRHLSIGSKKILDNSIENTEEINDINECYLFNFENNRWIDSNRIWHETLKRIKKESDKMEIIFNYDLVNKKEEDYKLQNSRKNSRENEPIILYISNDSEDYSSTEHH